MALGSKLFGTIVCKGSVGAVCVCKGVDVCETIEQVLDSGVCRAVVGDFSGGGGSGGSQIS